MVEENHNVKMQLRFGVMSHTCRIFLIVFCSAVEHLKRFEK